MEFIIDDFILKDIEDKHKVVNDIIDNAGYEYFNPNTISRAMAVYRGDELWGYFLTCCFLGVRSFHGFKFKHGNMTTQFSMARKYLDMEDLKYSTYRTKQAGIVLKVLGFKDIYQINNVTVAKRE